MRIFISGQSVEKFISRTGMIDLIEIHTVTERIAFRVAIALIEQSLVSRGIHRAQDFTVRIREDQLDQRRICIGQYETQAAGVCYACLPGQIFQRHILPGEDIIQNDLAQIRPVLGL